MDAKYINVREMDAGTEEKMVKMDVRTKEKLNTYSLILSTYSLWSYIQLNIGFLALQLLLWELFLPTLSTLHLSVLKVAIHCSPSRASFSLPYNFIISLHRCRFNWSSNFFCVVYKLTANDIDNKQHWSQNWYLKKPTADWHPIWFVPVYLNSLYLVVKHSFIHFNTLPCIPFHVLLVCLR